MDDEHGAEVIPLPRAFQKGANEYEAKHDELPVRTRREPRPCRHTRSWLDVPGRKVVCRDCNVDLDPIEVLHELARRREALTTQGLLLRRQVDALRQTLSDLERQERNAKSRIRGARKRRDDEAALEAAARQFRSEAGISLGIGGYRGWDELSEPQRGVVVGYVRQIVEAYAGALDSEDDETALPAAS